MKQNWNEPGNYLGLEGEIDAPTDNEKWNNQQYNMQIISKNCQNLREKHKYTHDDIAFLAGLYPYQIYRIEKNKYYNVTFKSLGLIARAFGITMKEFTDPDLVI